MGRWDCRCIMLPLCNMQVASTAVGAASFVQVQLLACRQALSEAHTSRVHYLNQGGVQVLDMPPASHIVCLMLSVNQGCHACADVCRYPLAQGHPYWTDASTLKRTPATEEEATALLMTAKPAYGWPKCQGKCLCGMCALRWDTPACCVVPERGEDYGRYSATAEPQLAAPETAGVSRKDSWHPDEQLYCWKD